VTSVGENEEKVNTIQPPFLCFSHLQSRARNARKEKVVASVQHHGNPRKQALARNPVQPGSFMVSARENNVCDHEIAEEGDHEKEGQKTMYVFNNPVFEKNETSGPGSKACRDQ